MKKTKYNKEYWLGALAGLAVVCLSLWILDKIIAWSFNGGINIGLLFNLNGGFIALSLLALVGIAALLYQFVKFVLWIVEQVINHQTYRHCSDSKVLQERNKQK
jgi:hypothetical protein